MAIENGAPQNTPHIGEGSEAEIQGIVLFLTFLAFRASVRNGCASRWASGQRMRLGGEEKKRVVPNDLRKGLT